MLTGIQRAGRFSALLALAQERPPQDPADRARWHLELRYEQAPLPAHAIVTHGDDYDGDFREPVTCWCCGGEGFEITCVDDLCHGAGNCMHGDGERTCRECHGDGVL